MIVQVASVSMTGKLQANQELERPDGVAAFLGRPWGMDLNAGDCIPRFYTILDNDLPSKSKSERPLSLER